MRKFEYTAIEEPEMKYLNELGSEGWMKYLNELGSEGWEAVSMTTRGDGKVIVLLKRDFEDNPKEMFRPDKIRR